MTRAVVVVAALLLLSGCGGGDETDTGSASRTTTTDTTDAVAPAPEPDREQEGRPPSRPDRSVQSELERHLRAKAATRSRREWGLDDIRDVRVAGRQVVVATRLAGSRGREQAGSLCFSTREFFLAGGQTQTPYDVFVTDGRTTLAAC